MLGDSKAFSGFTVDDADAARAFYADVLGLEVEVTNPEWGMLSLHIPGGNNVLVYTKSDHEPASYTALNFPVRDIEATVRQLTERGVAFERYENMDQDEAGIHRGGGPLIAWFRDPARNVLSVLES